MRMWLRNPCSESRASFAISSVTRLLKVNYLSQVAMLKHKGWEVGSSTSLWCLQMQQLSAASLICPFLPIPAFLLLLWEDCWRWQLWTWLAWFSLHTWWKSALLGCSMGMSSWSWHEAGKRRGRCPCDARSALPEESIDGEAVNWQLYLLSWFHHISITPVSRDV